MYVPRAMSMWDRKMLKRGSAFSARPQAVAVLPHGFAAAFIIRNPNAALVWPACGQSERK